MEHRVPTFSRLLDRAGLYALAFSLTCTVIAAALKGEPLEGLYWQCGIATLVVGVWSFLAARGLELALLALSGRTARSRAFDPAAALVVRIATVNAGATAPDDEDKLAA